ncbi:rhs element Vgr family protein, partial [Vibrio cholerae HC-80A1]
GYGCRKVGRAVSMALSLFRASVMK